MITTSSPNVARMLNGINHWLIPLISEKHMFLQCLLELDKLMLGDGTMMLGCGIWCIIL